MSDPREIIYDAQPATGSIEISEHFHAEHVRPVTLFVANGLDSAINVEVQISYDMHFRHAFTVTTLSLNAGTTDYDATANLSGDFIRAIITPLATVGSGTVRIVASGVAQVNWGG